MVQLYDFALPGSPKWLMGVIYVLGQVLGQVFFVLYTSHYSLAHLALVRTMGPVFNAILIVVFYTVWFMCSGEDKETSPERLLRDGLSDTQSECEDRGFRSATSTGGAGRKLGSDDTGTELQDTSNTFLLDQGEGGGGNGDAVRRSTATESDPIAFSPQQLQRSRSSLAQEFFGKVTSPTDSRRTSSVHIGSQVSFYSTIPPGVKVFAYKSKKEKLLCCFFAFLQLAGLFAGFLFCQSFTLEYFSSPQSKSLSVFLAAVFIAVMESMSFVVKRFGRLSDRLKSCDGVSCEVASEVYMSCFYCIFYRSLFQQLAGWGEFVAVTLVHVLVHFFVYPFRMTSFYFKISSRVIDALSFLPCLYDNSNPQQWNIRLSIDFTVRLYALVMSSLAYMVSVTFVRFGYNSDHYSFFGSQLSADAFNQLLLFQGVGCIVDIATVAITGYVTRSLVPGGALGSVVIFQQFRSFLIFFVMTGAHIITDVFLARVLLDVPAVSESPSLLPTLGPSGFTTAPI